MFFTKIKKRNVFFGLFFLLFLLLALGVWSYQIFGDDQVDKATPSATVRVGGIKSLTGFYVYVADHLGYFRDEGVNLELIDTYNSGSDTIAAAAREEVDIALSTETPFVDSVFNEEPVSIIADLLKAERHLALVADKEKITDLEDLIGKKVGVTFGSNGPFFYDLLLSSNGINPDSATLVNLKVAEMEQAIIDGQVDAVVTWRQIWQPIEVRLGEQAFVASTNLYSPHFLVIANNNFIKNHRPATINFLRALYRAHGFIESNPEEAMEIVKGYIGYDGGYISDFLSQCTLRCFMEQELITVLEDQARWYIENGLVKAQAVPNFLKYIRPDLMEEVAPDKLPFIH